MDIPTHIFFLTLVDPIMGRVSSANWTVRMIFIGHQIFVFIDKAIKLWGKLPGLNPTAGHLCGPNRAVVLNRQQDSLFGSSFPAFMFYPSFMSGFAASVFSSNSTIPLSAGTILFPGSIISRIAWPTFQMLFWEMHPHLANKTEDKDLKRLRTNPDTVWALNEFVNIFR